MVMGRYFRARTRRTFVKSKTIHRSRKKAKRNTGRGLRDLKKYKSSFNWTSVAGTYHAQASTPRGEIVDANAGKTKTTQVR